MAGELFAADAAKFGIEGILSGIANKRVFKKQAKASERSASRSFRAAEEAAEAGSIDEIRLRRRGQTELARIESLFADAGIGPEDVAQDVLLAAQREIEFDALLTRENAAVARRDLEDEGQEFLRSAKDAKKASKKAFFGLF